MAPRALVPFLLLTSLLVAACDESVDTPDSGGSGGAGGSSTTTSASTSTGGAGGEGGAGGGTGDAVYSAQFWAGGLDHITVLQAEPAADRCLMIFAHHPTESAPEFQVTLPDGWGISHAQITDSAADCAAAPMQPAGEVFNATGASGAISWELMSGMFIPCTLDLAVSVDFSGGPAWVPPIAELTATAVTVEGGCL